MQFIDKTIELNVPVRTAYSHWTQFERFPDVMRDIKYVKQNEDKTMLWEATILGKKKKWLAEITEQIPDEKISWRSTQGSINQGQVEFKALEANSALVSVHIEYQLENPLEELANKMGVISDEVQLFLESFKTYVEERFIP